MILGVCYRPASLVWFLAVYITIGEAKRCFIGTDETQEGCMRWSLGNDNLEDCVAILPGGYRSKVINVETEKSESFTTPVFKAIDYSESSSNELDGCQLEGRYHCSAHAKCIDIVDSFRCECNTGYEGDGMHCSDIDECEHITTHTVCNPRTACINTEGSYRCECLEGFTSVSHSDGLTSDELFCKDIDECNIDAQNTVCGNKTVCINTEGSYRCDCLEGFVRLSDPASASGEYYCQDIDECEQKSHGCSIYADCKNFDGSFACQCRNGFYGDGFDCFDINECEISNNVCPVHSYCYNTNGSYRCKCIFGFYWNGSQCIDTNECTITALNDCSPQVVCVNTDGSYECLCKAGYTGNGTHCVDIDECQLEIHNCTANNTVCKNIPASFECLCLDGCVWNGSDCIDIDECQLQIHNCSANNTFCKNIPGSFECPCSDGFVWNGSLCVLKPPLSIVLMVSWQTENGDTVNRSSSGLRLKGKCSHPNQKINECEMNFYPCNVTSDGGCANTEGSYQCYCFDSFNKSGKLCKDIDECNLQTHNCPETSYCKNTFGGYQCDCLDGFAKDGLFCYDIDECNLQTHYCPENSYCTNTLGGYQCDCLDGFTKDDLFCHDIDECATADHYCSEYNAGQCKNTEGSFECHCLDGFNGTWPYCAECPGIWSDSFEVTGDKYCVVSIKMTGDDASYFCESFGTHLAEVQNLEHNKQLANLIRNLNISSAWIGLRNIGGEWVFENGTPPTFANWNAGEPNYVPNTSYYQLFEENCAFLHDNTLWSSEKCLDIQMESICVKALDDRSATA